MRLYESIGRMRYEQGNLSTRCRKSCLQQGALRQRLLASRIGSAAAWHRLGFPVEFVVIAQEIRVAPTLRQFAPAAALGLYTYWIAPIDAEPPDATLLNGQGSLDVLAELVAGGWLERLGRPA